jgi:hypothetical protein
MLHYFAKHMPERKKRSRSLKGQVACLQLIDIKQHFTLWRLLTECLSLLPGRNILALSAELWIEERQIAGDVLASHSEAVSVL